LDLKKTIYNLLNTISAGYCYEAENHYRTNLDRWISSMLLLNFGQQVGGYMNFEEAEDSGSSAHVVGMWLNEGEFAYDALSNVFTFQMKDDVGNIRQVRYGNPKPANFEDAEKLVIEGVAEGDHFVAHNILVKCPSKYNDARGLQEYEAEPTSNS